MTTTTRVTYNLNRFSRTDSALPPGVARYATFDEAKNALVSMLEAGRYRVYVERSHAEFMGEIDVPDNATCQALIKQYTDALHLAVRFQCLTTGSIGRTWRVRTPYHWYSITEHAEVAATHTTNTVTVR